jgi:hypothetical protein
MSAKRIQVLRQAIAETTRALDKMHATREIQIEDLEKHHGVTTVKAAKKALTILKQSNAECRKSFDTALEAFETEYAERLEDD